MQFVNKLYLALCAFIMLNGQMTHAMGAKTASAIFKTAKAMNVICAYGPSAFLAFVALVTHNLRDQSLDQNPNASELVTEYIKTIASSCGFDSKNLRVKIHKVKKLTAMDHRTIVISPENNHNLTILLKQKNLLDKAIQQEKLHEKAITNLDYAAVSFRHETGHLHYKDATTSHVCANYFLEMLITFLIAKVLWQITTRMVSLPKLNSAKIDIAAAIGLVASGIFKSQLCDFISNINSRKIEKRADTFAFDHTTNPQELIAYAQDFENDYTERNSIIEKTLNDPNILKKIGWQWKTLIYYFLQRSYKNRSAEISSEQWINKNSTLLHAINYPSHPHPLSRAQAARAAAAKLEENRGPFDSRF